MKILKLTIGIVTAAVTLFLLGWATGIISLHYPQIVDDQPLEDPVKVTRVEGTTLFLADGRRIDADCEQDLDKLLAQSDFMIDVEGAGDDVAIYARQDGWVCGTPWTQPIRIPIFPETVYRNRRDIIAVGTIAAEATPANDVR